ncbi:hypothetical protein, partial [Nocardia gipuzkoensis]|uniref:hypothetical protein n=1 Tax=Nocardia gipuzkoensis TaxID=2749991 RepID=UPI0024546866
MSVRRAGISVAVAALLFAGPSIGSAGADPIGAPAGAGPGPVAAGVAGGRQVWVEGPRTAPPLA